jgi:integrase
MRINVEGLKGRAVVKSTKRSIYEEAYIVAIAEYERITTAIRLGKGLQTWTFAKHWENWFQRQIDSGNWRNERQTWHQNYYNRYFSEYFKDIKSGKSILLDDIDVDFGQRYFEWRIGYWKRTENAKKLKYNPKRRGTKNSATANAVMAPAQKTLKMEQSALNQIFFDAVERNRTQQRFRFKAPDVDSGDGQRAGFTAEEYQVLHRNLRSYKDGVSIFKPVFNHKLHKLMRQQIYCFIIFMANSGLRVGEARMMKWSDVKFDVLPDAGLDNERRIAEVRVSQHTKKRKVRYVQTQDGGNTQLKAWREVTPKADENDWVWLSLGKGNEVKQLGDLNRTFQKVLKTIPYAGRADGLLYDNDGKKRSLYSLRHVYADLRLSEGVDIQNLAKNMGTQIKQIELHYSHLQTRDARSNITQIKSRKVTKKADTPNDFVSGALQRFKEGKISESALREILASDES